jgi:alpha-aminoadipic semialdehyde synthase
MVPAPLHPAIAKVCIEEKTNMITASYVSEDMKGLEEEAKKYDFIYFY